MLPLTREIIDSQVRYKSAANFIFIEIEIEIVSKYWKKGGKPFFSRFVQVGEMFRIKT